MTEKYKISQGKKSSRTFPRKNYINYIFIIKKIKDSMHNNILKVIKRRNWGALENFGFEEKNW